MKNPKQEKYKFLRHYRATPHTTTGRAPAELLYNRPYKGVCLSYLTQCTTLSSEKEMHARWSSRNSTRTRIIMSDRTKSQLVTMSFYSNVKLRRGHSMIQNLGQ